MRIKPIPLLLILVVFLVSSCSLPSDVDGDEIRVEWISEDTWHDDKEFKDYTSFRYNGVYYKEIPNYGKHDTFVVNEANYWAIDTSQMRILGKMKVRNSSSAAVPPEVYFIYSYEQAYAYPQDESEPVFIYCFNHLWTRRNVTVPSPVESTVNGCILFRKVRESNSLTYKLEKVKTIEGPVAIGELFDLSTQKAVLPDSALLDSNFDLYDCYQLSFYNPDYPFLYSALNVAKLKNGKWYWVQENEVQGTWCFIITELCSKWNYDD